MKNPACGKTGEKCRGRDCGDDAPSDSGLFRGGHQSWSGDSARGLDIGAFLKFDAKIGGMLETAIGVLAKAPDDNALDVGRKVRRDFRESTRLLVQNGGESGDRRLSAEGSLASEHF